MSSTRSLLRHAALACMVAMLGGCALAPGGNFSGKVEAAGAAADPPPPGALQSITPELVRRQRAASADEFGTDVRRLFGEPKPYRIGSGDILNIVVWDHPDLVLAPAGSITTDAVSGSPVSNGYNVSADGQIQFPYVGPFSCSRWCWAIGRAARWWTGSTSSSAASWRWLPREGAGPGHSAVTAAAAAMRFRPASDPRSDANAPDRPA